jgi:hypothetical protein
MSEVVLPIKCLYFLSGGGGGTGRPSLSFTGTLEGIGLGEIGGCGRGIGLGTGLGFGSLFMAHLKLR